jgi:high frequency lysogenization protein
MSNDLNQLSERNIALAGVCQAATLVKQIARSGDLENESLLSSLHSIVVTNPMNTLEVFGSYPQLHLGFSTLVSQLDNQDTNKDVEITRYVASLLALERKVSANKKVLHALGERITHIQRQLAHQPEIDDHTIRNLAAIYVDLISPVGRKIQIAGNPTLLQRSDNQHKVRAVLLAGLRAAVLWRQLGGKRRHILFNRSSVLENARAGLNQSTRAYQE